MADAIARQPQNVNPVPANKFKFLLKRAPHLHFFCQEAEVPGVAINPAVHPSHVDDLPLPGDRLRRQDLRLVFLVDRDLKNYLEILEWMVRLASPEDTRQYLALKNADVISGEGVVSDLTLLVDTSAHVHNVEFRFQDCWPTALSSLRFETTGQTPVPPLQAEVLFKYRHYKVFRAHDTEELI